MPDYSGSRAQVEQHCPTSSVPKGERLFLAVQTVSPPEIRYDIVRYQDGVSLRAIIGQSAFSNSSVSATIIRSPDPMSGKPIKGLQLQYVYDGVVKPEDKPVVVLKPLDMIWLVDTRCIRN
jgi:hypothetical protein